MFTVRCPPSMVWHPSLHHSLLLLRHLHCRHTLLLEPTASSSSPLYLRDIAPFLRVEPPPPSVKEAAAVGGLSYVNRPGDILFFFHPSVIEGAHWPEAAASLSPYLDASRVSDHLLASVDAVLLGLQSGAPETVRVAHTALMEEVGRVEKSFEADDVARALSSSSPLPMSTWPLYTVLHFLVEEGGLLTSAYPTIGRVIRTLGERPEVRHHHRLVQRSLEAAVGGGSGGTAAAAAAASSSSFPFLHFLRDVQRVLMEYNTSARERVEGGTTGDKGPLAGRHGRLGLQSVPAHLPWTMQNTRLTPRN